MFIYVRNGDDVEIITTYKKIRADDFSLFADDVSESEATRLAQLYAKCYCIAYPDKEIKLVLNQLNKKKYAVR